MVVDHSHADRFRWAGGWRVEDFMRSIPEDVQGGSKFLGERGKVKARHSRADVPWVGVDAVGGPLEKVLYFIGRDSKEFLQLHRYALSLVVPGLGAQTPRQFEPTWQEY